MPGELRMHRQDSSGQWLCNVQYRPSGELSSHVDTFGASEIHDANGDATLMDDPVRGSFITQRLEL